MINFLWNLFSDYEALKKSVVGDGIKIFRYIMVLFFCSIFTKSLSDQIILSMFNFHSINLLFLNFLIFMMGLLFLFFLFSLFVYAANGIFSSPLRAAAGSNKVFIELKKVFSLSLLPFFYFLFLLPVAVLSLVTLPVYLAVFIYSIFCLFLFAKIFRKIYLNLKTNLQMSIIPRFFFIFIPLISIFLFTILLSSALFIFPIWKL